MKYTNAVSYVHEVLRQVVTPGAVVVDATIGNGWDTALMAELAGPQGVVYGFDVQPLAIEVTQTRVASTPCDVRLMLSGHEEMMGHVETEHHGVVRAVTFNLGYLPGGDKDITTMAETTRVALEQARTLLAPDGVITIVCYRHTEGERELRAVRELLSGWPQQQYVCAETHFINQVGNPPVVFVVHRLEQSVQLP